MPGAASDQGARSLQAQGITLIYTEDVYTDFRNLLDFINAYSKQPGHYPVDTDQLWSVCTGMRADFPHLDGMEKSSAFKKVSNFLVYFMAEKPIKETTITLGSNGEQVVVDSNAVIGLHIAIVCLNNSTIIGKDGSSKPLKNRIYISDHSYCDMIQIISKGLTPQIHFHLICVYLEQLVYKCNPDLEYPEMTYYPKS